MLTKNAQILLITGIGILSIGMLVTLGILYSIATKPNNSTDFLFLAIFNIWAIAPLLVLLTLSLIAYLMEFSASLCYSLFATSLVVTLILTWGYFSVLHDKSSTSALIFVVLPVYGLIGIPVVNLLVWLTIRIVRRV